MRYYGRVERYRDDGGGLDSDDAPQGYEEGEPDEETAGAEGEVERSEVASIKIVSIKHI